MTNDFDSVPPRYSSFVPLLILLIGFIGSSGYQLYVTNHQRVLFNRQLEMMQPQIVNAQSAGAKLVSVAQDLVQLSAKNTYAAQLVKENNIKLNAPEGAPAASPAK